MFTDVKAHDDPLKRLSVSLRVANQVGCWATATATATATAQPNKLAQIKGRLTYVI